MCSLVDGGALRRAVRHFAGLVVGRHLFVSRRVLRLHDAEISQGWIENSLPPESINIYIPKEPRLNQGTHLLNPAKPIPIPIHSHTQTHPAQQTMPPQPRHALITGGSRGIGLAIAQALSKQNYRCTLISRSESTLKAALSTLEPTAAPHRYIAGSISAPDFWSISHFKENGLGKGEDESRIDVLVNCAGITQSRLFATTPAEDVQDIIDTNLTALMLGTRFLLRNKYLSTTSRSRSEAVGKGFTPSIINVASLLGVSGGYGAVAYAASKAGVLGFTRALAGEYVGHGVRVNAIVPGYVESDMTKGRFSSVLLRAGALADGNRSEHVTAPRADPAEAIWHTGRDCTCSAVSCGKSVCA